MSEAGVVGMAEILRLFAALAFVVGILLLSGYLLRKRLPGGRARSMEVEERLSLGKGAQIVIIGIHGRRMLVGVSEGGIRLISEIESSEVEERSEPRIPSTSTIAEWFRKEKYMKDRDSKSDAVDRGILRKEGLFEVAMRQARGRHSEMDR